MKGGFKCIKERYTSSEKDLCLESCPFECKVNTMGEHICVISGADVEKI